MLEQYPLVRQPRRSAVIVGLTYPPMPDDQRVFETLITALDDKEAQVVAAAVDGLARWQADEMLNQILRLMKHPSPYVQGSVLRFVSKLFPRMVFPMLLRAAHAPHYIVRENAADELGELVGMSDTEKQIALIHLRRLLKDRHPHVRQAAQWALEDL